MEFANPLTGGIIIVGSLFWDSHETRKDLRENYLKIQNAVDVPAPIRYGRLSQKRGTITMVVSPGCKSDDKIGTGKLVPFLHPINDDIDLEQVAQAIIRAEMKKEPIDSKFYWDWGCLALLPNPDKIQEENIRQLTSLWASKFEPDFKSGNYIIEYESELLDQNGSLNLKWHKEYGDVDFLVLTTTQPNIPIPSIAYLVECFNKVDDYFRNNRKHGIQTFQDAEILEILNASHEKES